MVQDTEGKSGDDGLFKAPVRLKAGDKWLGENRLYPSPVLHDLDGDGLPDVVIGDLFGKVTVATRLPAGEKAIRFGQALSSKTGSTGTVTYSKVGNTGIRFAAEKAIQNREGQPLKFHNW